MDLRNIGILSQHYTASQPEDESSIDLRNAAILPQLNITPQPKESST
jgi:hypothetical protein